MLLFALAALASGSAAPPASLKTIRGTPQNDSLVGTAANDRLYGLAGNDKLDGKAGSDTLSGGSGNDTLTGGGGFDFLEGGAGNDVLRSDRDLLVKGEAGNDSIYIANKILVLVDGTIKDSLLQGLQLVSCGRGTDSISVSGRVLNKSVLTRFLHLESCETVKFTR